MLEEYSPLRKEFSPRILYIGSILAQLRGLYCFKFKYGQENSVVESLFWYTLSDLQHFNRGHPNVSSDKLLPFTE